MLRKMSDLLQHFQDNWIDWIMYVANGMLIILMVFTMGYEFYSMLMIANNNASLQSKLSIPDARPIQAEKSISTWHLFGKSVYSTQSNVKWILRGIVIGNQEKENEAIIASTDSDEKLYNIGNKLSDGSTILNIDSNRVVLSHDDRIETLYLSWDANEMIQSNPSNQN